MTTEEQNKTKFLNIWDPESRRMKTLSFLQHEIIKIYVSYFS